MRDLADRRMLASSRYPGQPIVGYRESLGGDCWHAQVILAYESQVYLDVSQ